MLQAGDGGGPNQPLVLPEQQPNEWPTVCASTVALSLPPCSTHRMAIRAGTPRAAAGGVRQVQTDHAATPAISTPLPPYLSARAPV